MNKKLIVKSNKLISANYDLTLNQQKIIIYSISKIDKNAKEANLLTIEIKKFFELINSTTERYAEIREIVRDLRTKEIIIEDDAGNELIMGWLSSIEYKHNKGLIELEFSKKIMPYLYQLKEQFTKYELKNILYLKSGYSIRIYELLKQYEKIGTRIIKVDELRKFLGIKEDQYKRFTNFENRVLKIATEEINEDTDLTVSYNKIKKGRKIDEIEFFIECNNSQEDKEYREYLKENYDIKEMKKQMGLEEENFNEKQIIEIYGITIEKIGDELEDEKDIFEYINYNYHYVKEKDGIKIYLLI